MKKKVIGIVPSATMYTADDPYTDQYRTVNFYGKRIYEMGAVPITLVPVDGQFVPEAVELCDGIIIAGGTKIWPYHFQIAEYAITHGIPLLGICMGIQTIHAYFCVKEEAERRGYEGQLLAFYDQMKKERFMFVNPVEGHWDQSPSRSDLNRVKHQVEVFSGSRLSRFLGDPGIISAATLHKYRINEDILPQALTISARALDGTIEGVEAGEKILGVQFHPEIDRELEGLFCGFFEH